jgi:hypothetical protein
MQEELIVVAHHEWVFRGTELKEKFFIIAAVI